MDWQQALSFAIVALSAFMLVRGWMRKKKRRASSHCSSCSGCDAEVQSMNK